MKRAKIKLKKNKSAKGLEILTFTLIFISAAVIGFYYNQIPEKVPIYFDWPSKDKNGFATKDILWASPIICGIIVLAIYKLNQHPWILNYPTEINEKNAEYNYKMSTQMLRILGLIIAFMCLALTLTSVLFGLGYKIEFEKYLALLFPILLIGFPIFYVIRILMKKNYP